MSSQQQKASKKEEEFEKVRQKATQAFVNKKSLQIAENVPRLEERWRDVVKEKAGRVERKVEEEDNKRKQVARGIVNESSR